MWIVTVLYWLQLFLCPTLIAGIVISVLTKDLSVAGFVIGGIFGIVAAEYVRRKIGLSTFFAGIYDTGEIIKKLDEKD
jgi:hypothetical protein